MWRATKRPEDPVETYKRMNNATQDDFNKMMFDYACRAATWDIDGIRDRGKDSQNAFSTRLTYVEGTENTYAVSADCCPQNYGFNIIPLKGFKSGTTIKVDFKGVGGAVGYRNLNVSKAGWRYGFVAQTEDGGRVYGPSIGITLGMKMPITMSNGLIRWHLRIVPLWALHVRMVNTPKTMCAVTLPLSLRLTSLRLTTIRV